MTFLLAAALLQPALADPPIIPALGSRAFKQQSFLALDLLSRGEYDGAAAVASTLPGRSLKVEIRSSGLNQEAVQIYSAAIRLGVGEWANAGLPVSIVFVEEGGDLVFSFMPQPVQDAAGQLRSLAIVESYGADEPRIEASISVTRAGRGQTTEPSDASHDAAYAVGRALGLDELPRFGGVMSRSEGGAFGPVEVREQDVQLALRGLTAADEIRRLAAEKVRVKGARPKIKVTSDALDFGRAVQGEAMSAVLKIANDGQAPLEYAVLPDCGCFVIPAGSQAGPGASQDMTIGVRTMEFPGPVEHALYVYSNDPDAAVVRIPTQGLVAPLWRFLDPEGAGVVYLGPEPQTRDVILALSQPELMDVLEVEAQGAESSVEAEPWEGDLPDPSGKEGLRWTSGYRLRVTMQGAQVFGRFPVSLTVRTTDERMPYIRHSFFAQRGIVARPRLLYLGELARQPFKAWAVIERPGRPFKITSVRTTMPSVTANWEPFGEPGVIKVNALYDGTAPAGRLDGSIIIGTDDPEQPEVVIAISGIVK